jgi:hypothetical protein
VVYFLRQMEVILLLLVIQQLAVVAVLVLDMDQLAVALEEADQMALGGHLREHQGKAIVAVLLLMLLVLAAAAARGLLAAQLMAGIAINQLVALAALA